MGALPADRVVRDGPPALLDVGRVRALRVPTVGVLHRDGAAVVLGSMQRVEDLEPAALARDGVAVLRRRGGGGAVLLGPDDCWVELWLPCPHHGEDLRATACTVGEWWEVALAALGVAGAVHRGGVEGAPQGAVACFAGLGPGEVTVAGRKLVGLSQWRCREGALVSSVIARRPPRALARYLAATAPPTPALEDAACMEDVEPALGAPQLAAAFTSTVRASLPNVRVTTSLPG